MDLLCRRTRPRLGQLLLASVHTTPEKSENAVLFLRLWLASTLIRHENRAFRNRSSNRKNLKTPTLRFREYGKHFENGAFRKRWRRENHVISLTEVSSNTNPKFSRPIRNGNETNRELDLWIVTCAVLIVSPDWLVALFDYVVVSQIERFIVEHRKTKTKPITYQLDYSANLKP